MKSDFVLKCTKKEDQRKSKSQKRGKSVLQCVVCCQKQSPNRRKQTKNFSPTAKFRFHLEHLTHSYVHTNIHGFWELHVHCSKLTKRTGKTEGSNLSPIFVQNPSRAEKYQKEGKYLKNTINLESSCVCLFCYFAPFLVGHNRYIPFLLRAFPYIVSGHVFMFSSLLPCQYLPKGTKQQQRLFYTEQKLLQLK